MTLTKTMALVGLVCAHYSATVADVRASAVDALARFRNAEENNAENLPVIRPPELAAKYADNWEAHAEHSDVYEGKEKGYSETHRAAAVPVAEGFVASARSQVLHRPDCKSAAKILETNLVHYNGRAEAVQAGKKPCHECDP